MVRIILTEHKEEKTTILPDLARPISESEWVIKVEDLYTNFYTVEGVVKAVDGVSFSINPNEILGLVGETGCGKSVTALSVMRLIPRPGKIESGRIFLENENLFELPLNDMRKYRGNRLTMIFQDPMNTLNPVLTVGDQLGEVFLLHQKEELKRKEEIEKEKNKELRSQITEIKHDIAAIKKKIKELDAQKTPRSIGEIEPLNHELEDLNSQVEELKSKINKKTKLKDVAKNEAAELLKKVGIADSQALVDRYPHELSGGMNQRVMIAMGLACEPKLLICDEPTTALDVTIQAQILNLIRDLQAKTHCSVLFITHNLGVIYELCDRVAVMYSGNIVEYGKVFDIFENPQHPYTKGLLAAIPRISKKEQKPELDIIPGFVPNLIFPPRGCRFHPRCEHAMKKCKTDKPALFPLENGVSVACFLYDTDKSDSESYEKLTDEEKMEESF
jgi:peptide/nickel transport system ATP-binding protein